MELQQSFAKHEGVGSLFLVGTPIGNLEDMTFRAIRTLREVDWIAAEDTRQTRKLLTHFEIATRMVSYHEHNKAASGPELVRLMLEGASVALVTDAGMPAISDPGFALVQLANEQRIPVVPIPGANAALSALVVSGLPTDCFTFVGFLPREKRGIQEQLDKLNGHKETLILYESPHRIRKTLAALLSAWGNRRAALVRELTKRYEEVARGTLQELADYLAEHEPLGEYCLVVEGRDERAEAAIAAEWWTHLTVEQHVEHYHKQTGDRKEAMKKAALDRGVPKREIYNQLLQPEQ